MTPRTHLRRERARKGLDMRFGVCGVTGAVSESPDAVTCRACRKLITKAAAVTPASASDIGEERIVVGGARSITEREARIIERSRLGHEPTPRVRFGSWASLHDFHAAVIDDGSAARSSSDPSRFGARVSSSRCVAGGGGRDDIISIDLALERACVEPMVVGDSLVSGEVLLAVYLARCEGRPVNARTAPGRKGRVTKRIELSAEDVAEQWGRGHTAKHVAIVVRGLRWRLRPLLVEMGMMEAAQESAEKDDEMNIPGFDLHGWAQIAGHLGMSSSAAARLMDAEQPPPVKRTMSKRVIAKREELDEWMLAHALVQDGAA